MYTLWHALRLLCYLRALCLEGHAVVLLNQLGQIPALGSKIDLGSTRDRKPNPVEVLVSCVSAAKAKHQKTHSSLSW